MNSLRGRPSVLWGANQAPHKTEGLPRRLTDELVISLIDWTFKITLTLLVYINR